ncbi:Uma2 family endonuclease [Fortiea contorta]|uniref:Uma2 family endonuclease n=1 Tax=Fortiea contorta TaxID=1892405 RepID=UPI000349DFC8|nr:Uma2 family endonuclease [Fortiea contorta]
MTPTQVKQLTFTEFLAQSPDDAGIYELVDGEIVQVDATRAHKNVARFLVKSFNRETERLGLDYIVDKDIVVRTVNKNGQEQGRRPDVSVVSGSLWNANVFDYGAVTEPISLAVEVISTNWEDDYVDKLDEYQRLGINEYWIVDYLAIASRAYLGNPKIPAVFVYNLIDGQYQSQRYTLSDRIVSQIFPELTLTVEQVVSSSQLRKL